MGGGRGAAGLVFSTPMTSRNMIKVRTWSQPSLGTCAVAASAGAAGEKARLEGHGCGRRCSMVLGGLRWSRGAAAPSTTCEIAARGFEE